MSSAARYLVHPDELREVGVRLGIMTDASYEEFEAKARNQPHSFKTPKLGITLEFKPGMGIDQPYPILQKEWETFIRDIPTYCRSIPEVYLYDADQFTLPI